MKNPFAPLCILLVGSLSFLLAACGPEDSADSAAVEGDRRTESAAGDGSGPEQAGAVGYGDAASESSDDSRQAGARDETGASASDIAGSASETDGGYPDSPVQGQRPYELLLTAGLDEDQIDELAQDGFPQGEVEARVRESLAEMGREEEYAEQQATEIASWIAQWTEGQQTP